MTHTHFYLHNHQTPITLTKAPTLLYSGFVVDEPTWHFTSHAHSFCEIVYICEGRGAFMIDSISYRVKKGDILIYNKGVVHDEESDPLQPLKTYFCGIGSVCIQDQEPDHLLPNGVCPVIHCDTYSNKIESFISEIVHESSYRIKGHEVVCSNILSILIINILRLVDTNSDILPTDNPFISDITRYMKEFIEKNYTKTIRLTDLAKKFYMSKDYLSHVFKNDTGLSPINYLIQLKFEEAKRLLLTTNDSICSIATQIGYDDPNYFTQMFKRMVGVSPLNYRKSNHSDATDD